MEALLEKPKRSGNMNICLKVKAYNPCPEHLGQKCDCEKPLVGTFEKEDDLATKQFAQLVRALILNDTQTITDTSNATHSVANAAACTTPTILAGTSGTTPTVLDYALGAQTETVAGTVGGGSGATTTYSFTVAGTITATADRAYAEVGLRVTLGGFLYLIAHDIFSPTTPLNVSNTGTLAVTYTITFS